MFNWYLVQFLVNTFDEVYLSAIGSSVSDIIGYLFGGVLFYKFGTKASLFISFAISTIGGIAILCYGVDNSGSPLFSILVFLAKFGISCAFQILFVAHTSVFPTLFCTTSMGFC